MNVLRDLEPKMFELIGSLMSEELEELLKACILVVDDLTATLKRYEQLKNKEALDIFIPGESYLNTIIHPSTVYERLEAESLMGTLNRRSSLKPME